MLNWWKNLDGPIFGAINGNEAVEFDVGIDAATKSENLIGRLSRRI